MKKGLGEVFTSLTALVEKAKLRKGMFLVLAILFVFQLYFVRELLVAELLFAVGFAILLVLGGIFYLVGAIGERGLDWAEAGVRVIGDSARRGYSSLEEISRKPFRHPRSESAQ
jgi:uncharacterized membrane protein HdeD (DUF308 family)